MADPDFQSPAARSLLRRVRDAEESAPLRFPNLSRKDQALAKSFIRSAVPLLRLEDGLSLFLTGEGVSMLSASEKAAQDIAKEKADQDDQKAADHAQREIDRKKQFRHDFKVAAFSVILALVLEHLPGLIQRLLHCIISLINVPE